MMTFTSQGCGALWFIGRLLGEKDMPDVSKEEILAALKEGAKEWFYEMKAEVGGWTMKMVTVATVFAIGYFILTVNGWKKP